MIDIEVYCFQTPLNIRNESKLFWLIFLCDVWNKTCAKFLGEKIVRKHFGRNVVSWNGHQVEALLHVARVPMQHLLGLEEPVVSFQKMS
jgi:hypothetical protein